jgi:hypothetical protein
MRKKITHQPRLDDDPTLDRDNGGIHYLSDFADLYERFPVFQEYPETRALPTAGTVLPVFPDEFVGTAADGSAIQNNTRPEKPEQILGSKFNNTGGKFNVFLEALLKACRNYNVDMFNLRQELFHVRMNARNPGGLAPLIALFNQAADELSQLLAKNDRRSPDKDDPFAQLGVEFVKINGYIASIRAGATETDEGAAEFQFSSSSHISVSSMFSSSRP